MMRTFLLLINVIGLQAFAWEDYVYYEWGRCWPRVDRKDQSCKGLKSRIVITDFQFIPMSYYKIYKECLLTKEKVDGGYTSWSAWDDCSTKCGMPTNKYRTCHNPTPCNKGNDCKELGSATQTKICGPFNGQWGDWESWGSCSKSDSKNMYGTGTHVRYRYCNNPPAMCGGDVCVGLNSQDGICRVVPSCLTSKIFEEQFLKNETAMVIYTTTQVDIYTLTKNKCTMATIIYNYWELYRVNETSGEEEQIGGRSYTLKFKVSPGVFELGLYRLYVKIGYPQKYYHWMEESMYFRIVHPPPHAFIKGGAGKTIGQGMTYFDARSVSYSLTKKPGDPTGLMFRWKCLNVVSKFIYNLLAFNIDARIIFADKKGDNLKWYHTSFTVSIDELVPWIKASTLHRRVSFYRTLNVNCSTADALYVNVNITGISDDIATPPFTTDSTSSDTTLSFISSSSAETTYFSTASTPAQTSDQFDMIKLTSFYDILYLADMFDSPVQYLKLTQELSFPDYNTLVTNELITFLDFFYGSTSTLISDSETFFEKISESSLTLKSILKLRGLDGLPKSANESFFNDLEIWINSTKDAKDIITAIAEMLNGFKPYYAQLNIGMNLTSLIGIDGFLQLSVDESQPCILQLLGDIIEGLFNINGYNWHQMKDTELFYLNWMDRELITSSECIRFHDSDYGSAEVEVVGDDVDKGMGFLVYIRVEFEESVSYFIQHAQTVIGTPPELEIECRLNCMKKTAISSIISLKARCLSCTFDQLSGSKVWWNVKDFNIYSRRAKNNLFWREWMLSDPNTRSFVMRAGEMDVNTGYLIESFMETSTGQLGLGIWTIYTNILPYDGTCVITDAIWDEKKVITAGWKDEGFRSNNDVSLDWKEQLNYRIVQLSQAGDAMLYYGSEQENYITVKPGQAVDNYNVVIKIEIFDIFIDFMECFVDIGYIFPNYTSYNKASVSTFLDTSADSINYYMKSGDIKQVTMKAEVAGTPVTELIFHNYKTDDKASVSTFLDTSADSINYYMKSGDIKQVIMNAEVAGTPVTELTIPKSKFDVEPDAWINIGTTSYNGTDISQTFDELWNIYQNSDTEVNDKNSVIKQKLSSFVGTLDEVSNTVDGTSTTKIVQIANSIGTIISNKDFVDNSSASSAIKGSTKLLQKLILLSQNETYPKYEDYISVCTGILRVLNNILEGVLPKTSIETPSHVDIYSMANFLAVRQHLNHESHQEIIDLTPLERAFIAARIAEQNRLDVELKNDIVKIEIPRLVSAISNLGHVLRMLNHRKQMLVSVKNAYINSTEDAKLIYELLESGFHLDEVDIDFRESKSRSTEEQNIQVTLYDHTPFSWDEESRFISSKTVTISVGNDHETNTVIPSKIKLRNSAQTMTAKSVQLAIPKFDWDEDSIFNSSERVTISLGNDNETNTVIPSKIKLRNSAQKMTAMSIQLAIPVNTNDETSQMVIYQMYWQNPLDNMILGILNAVHHLNHAVYVSRNKEPTEDDYDWRKTVTSEDWISNDEIKLIVSGGLYQKSSLVYVGILVSKESTGVETDLNITGTSETMTIEYNIVSATVGCRVWDDQNQKWDKTHCTVDSSSTITETVCVCTDPPGNSFATTFYVPPNTIDFSTVFSKFNLTDNAAVFSTVICLVVVYVLICVWALRQDKKDIDRWGISYMNDNFSLDRHLYMLTVYTGLNRQAGTTSNVMFMVIDINGQTHIRRLEGGKHQGFGVGSVRRFIMATPKKMTELTAIKIWHDNSGTGGNASWYLNKIIMEDIQTNEKYVFIYEKWPSVEEDGGSLDCVIPVSNKADITTFSYLCNANFRHNITDSHLWMSVAIRPENSNFTRAQRLSCCLALLFLTMIANAMFYGQDTGSKITIGPIKFSLTGIYISLISALVAAPPVLLATYLFRNARHMKPGKVQGSGIIITPTGLPYACRFVAWAIVTAAIIVSGYFLILYSMEWAKVKSEGWLVSFFLSFMESVFIVDPLKILVFSVIASLIMKDQKDSQIIYDRNKLLKETQRHAPSFSVHLRDTYSPIKKKKVQQMRKERKEIQRARKTFIELILFMAFLIVLYLVSFSNRDPQWFFVTQHIQQELIHNPHTTTRGTSQLLSKVSSTATFYNWLNDMLIPFLFPRISINNVPLTAKQRIYTQDHVNLRVGPLRLRQVRSPVGECQTTFLSKATCYNKYSIIEEDDEDYCVGWKEGPCDRRESVFNVSSPAWKFSSATRIWGLPTTGIHSTYGGGGYIAEMAINYNISNMILNDLYSHIWIDRSTRAVFTEFTLYNVGANVFVYVSMICEFSEIGGVSTSYSIKPFRPYQHVGSFGLLVFICELIVLIAILLSGIFKIIDFYKHGSKTLKDSWNLLEIIIIVLFLVCTAMYIVRWLMINKALVKFDENKDMFVNFSHIALWDDIFNIFLASVIFLTTLRLMKILSYNERINQLWYVLAEVSRELFGFLIIFLIIYLAFVVVGYLIFGHQLEAYRNIFESSGTLMNAIIGKNSIADLFTVQPILGRVYYFLLVFFILWILITMLNATLNVGITSVKGRLEGMTPTYGITNILTGMLKDTFGIFVKHNNNNTILKRKKSKKNVKWKP